jgi:hypothetical protein
MPRLFALALLTASASVGAASDYAGARSCAGCHLKQAAAQRQSGHAQALSSAAEHPLIRKLPAEQTFYRPPDFRLTWRRDAGKIGVTATDKKGAVVSRPVHWAFGAGSQAITFVSQLDEDRYVEHHLSWYAANKLALTPGHRGTAPSGPEEALGVIYRTFAPDAAILRCFRCHSTGPLTLDRNRSVQPFESGIRCEACHGPGQTHVQRPVKATIYNPGVMDGTAMNKVCGNCHRPPASAGEQINWRDPWNTRHQPLYLARSKCFLATAGKLRCITCHDPHRPLERAAAAYNRQCTSCHTMPHNADGDCISCHMPSVKPNATLAFTNHWIGVFGSDKLQPR